MADDLSEISWSGVSDTDQMIFSVLSNSERTDMTRIPRVSMTNVVPVQTIEEEPRIEDVTPPSPRSLLPMEKELNFTNQSLSYEMDMPFQTHEKQEPIHNVYASHEPTVHEPTVHEPTVHEPTVHEHSNRLDADLNNENKDNIDTSERKTSKEVFEYSKNEDEELQKRSVLLDLQQLSLQNGVKLTKEWTMDDRLEDMLLEMRRHSLAQDEKSNVNMMRDGMRLLITGIEMVNNKIGILDLEGWSTEVCRDLNKHDANLARIYRKYWRRGNNNSPEMSIAMSLFGSMGMHHLRRTMSKNFVNKAQRNFSSSSSRKTQRHQTQSNDTDSSEDEAPPKRT
jgi:hypothetical protein